MERNETLLNEWTDGKLFIRNIVVQCDSWKVEKYRLFLYGDQHSQSKEITGLFGHDQGPSGKGWHTSDELNVMLDDWLKSVPTELERDIHIIQSLQILLQGSEVRGLHGVSTDSIRTQFLRGLPTLIVLYMSHQTKMTNDDAESLVNSMTNLSF